jgi:diguanylate cyclase (GGDEF)-like protein
MTPRPLKVLVADPDRAALRQVSRFLGALGYEVAQAADADAALVALAAVGPDFLLLDESLGAGCIRELCGAVRAPERCDYPYTLLLLADPSPAQVLESLAAGADDVLRRPLVRGELMARLRAGARAIEYERRSRRAAEVESLSGLPSRRGLADEVRRALAPPRAAVSLVVLDVDFFGRINRSHGHAAGDLLLRALAARLGDLLRQGDVAGHLGGGRFAVLVRGGESAAADWAEHVRSLLGETELAAGGVRERLTASFGVAAAEAEERSAEALLEQAELCLRMAKASGRNCVVRRCDVDADRRALDDPGGGGLFQTTVARDVMSACPVLLDADAPLAEAAALFAQARLPACLVADGDGRPLGVVAEQDLAGLPGDEASRRRVGDRARPVPTCDEATPFAELVERFADKSVDCVGVVADGRPTGLVARATLSALGEKLHAESFVFHEHAVTGDVLLVPDVAVADE